MVPQDPQSVDFVSSNLVVIGLLVVVVFGYFIFLMRKRKKADFLHRKGEKNK